MIAPICRIIGAGHIGRLEMKSEPWKRLLAGFTAILLFGGTAVFAGVNDGLLAYYPLDGNANDASGNGHNGVVSSATLTADRFGVPDSAYAFNGINDYIEIFSLNSYPVLTLSAWAKWEAGSSQDAMVIISGDNYGYDRSLQLTRRGLSGSDTNEITVHAGQAAGPLSWLRTGVMVTNNTWTHYAVEFTSDNIHLFVNGAWVWSWGAPATGWNEGNWRIGANLADGWPFKGAIDDVRIYDRALSEAEIWEIAGGEVDTDGDGVLDASDQCPNTPAGEVVNAVGCSISQLVPASWPWENHGEYVSAVSKVSGEFMAQGLITGAQKGAIVSAAARSDVGKRR
jgi:hypothetical protein